MVKGRSGAIAVQREQLPRPLNFPLGDIYPAWLRHGPALSKFQSAVCSGMPLMQGELPQEFIDTLRQDGKLKAELFDIINQWLAASGCRLIFVEGFSLYMIVRKDVFTELILRFPIHRRMEVKQVEATIKGRKDAARKNGSDRRYPDRTVEQLLMEAIEQMTSVPSGILRHTDRPLRGFTFVGEEFYCFSSARYIHFLGLWSLFGPRKQVHIRRRT